MKSLRPLRRSMASMAGFSRWTLATHKQGPSLLSLFLHFTAIRYLRSLPNGIPISLNLLVVMSRM